MDDPFEQQNTSRRARTTSAEKKLEAAKEVLRDELRELKESDPTTRVAIFSFREDAELVYDGGVDDSHAIHRAIDVLTAADGTDIAAALNAAADYRSRRDEGGLTSLMLISDGKSDRTKALTAARRCRDLSIALYMLLIDPTDEGKAFALDVVRSAGGNYQPVVSRAGLGEAAKVATDAHAAASARAEGYLHLAMEEAERVASSVVDREQVKFTAAYPGRIDRDRDYLLRVYIHLDSESSEVEERLRQALERFGGRPRKSESEASQRIPIGTNLEITPRINFVAASPAQQSVTWLGALEELSFRIYYAGSHDNPPPCSGFIDISASGLLVGQLPVSIVVDTGESRIEQRTANMLARVFASYSHTDEAIVRACKAAYRALGIQLFIDKDNLVSGEQWRPVLRQNIANHDAFQLYWSQAAADSDEVANEWKLARQVAVRRTAPFIRPLYWSEPMPSPPAELSDLHFDRLDLKSLAVHVPEPVSASSSPPAPATRIEVDFPIVDTMDSDPEWVRWLHQQMGEIVPFLDNLIGIRYFPPVTFVVDEHIVRTARQALTTDRAANQEGEDASEHVIRLLQSLALAFHVGKLVDEGLGWEMRAEFFQAAGGDARADYDHVVQMAEWLFAGPTTNYLAGKDVLKEATRSFAQVLQNQAAGAREYSAARMVMAVLERATADERQTVMADVTPTVLDDLDSSDQRRNQKAAATVLQSDLPRLAIQHRIVELFHQIATHSLRNHPTFPEYLADFLRHWLEYTAIARTKRPGAVINVGYAVPEGALQWLRRQWPDLRFRVTRDVQLMGDRAANAYFEMPIESYERCVQRLAPLMLAIVRRPQQTQIASVVDAATATHGVYVPADATSSQLQVTSSLAKRGWPETAAMPNQHKILISVEAVKRFEEALMKMGRDGQKARELSRRFSLGVLVHEHFHAAVATGLDPSGKPALGHDQPERWDAARSLNESLAVWSERHFFRSDAEMLTLVDSFIASGEYPQWPYRGAEALESIYARGGLPSVRGWMRHLRDDPEQAQSEFDQIAAGASVPR